MAKLNETASYEQRWKQVKKNTEEINTQHRTLSSISIIKESDVLSYILSEYALTNTQTYKYTNTPNQIAIVSNHHQWKNGSRTIRKKYICIARKHLSQFDSKVAIFLASEASEPISNQHTQNTQSESERNRERKWGRKRERERAIPVFEQIHWKNQVPWITNKNQTISSASRTADN